MSSRRGYARLPVHIILQCIFSCLVLFPVGCRQVLLYHNGMPFIAAQNPMRKHREDENSRDGAIRTGLTVRKKNKGPVAPCFRLRRKSYLLLMYMVTSKPKRMSLYVGVCHFIVVTLLCVIKFFTYVYIGAGIMPKWLQLS